MTYTIPNDIAKRIDALVAGGAFCNEADVLREALSSLEHRMSAVEKLRTDIQQADEDIALGRVAKFDADKTKRAVRKRLADHGNDH